MTFSLQTRTLAVLALLLVLGLAISDTVSAVALRNFLVNRTDQQLGSLEPGLRMNAEQRLGFNPRGGGPPHGELTTPELGSTLPIGSFMGIYKRDGTTVQTYSHTQAGLADTTPKLPDPLPNIADEPGVVLTVASAQSGGPDYLVHIWGVRNGAGYLALAMSLQSVNDTVAGLVVIAGIVSAVVLLAAVGLGWWLIRAGLRPLERIASTADAIAGGDLSLRAPQSDPRTEVGRLATAFNSMLGEIEHAFAEQRASEERLRRFIADASHELRTPLTSVRGYAELFRRGARARPADLAKAMSRIEQEASRMGLLVDDMLLLARLDQGRPLRMELVDLTQVAGEGVDAALAVEPERPLTLEASGAVLVEGDAQRLRQVVDNLLANVRVHTPAGSQARVQVSAEDGVAYLRVSDSGPGITPDRIPHIFERFYRVDQGRSRDQGGSGLGLSIVSAIAAAHGGSAEVWSRPGRGTTFTVRIPAARAEPGHAPGAGLAEAGV